MGHPLLYYESDVYVILYRVYNVIPYNMITRFNGHACTSNHYLICPSDN